MFLSCVFIFGIVSEVFSYKKVLKSFWILSELSQTICLHLQPIEGVPLLLAESVLVQPVHMQCKYCEVHEVIFIIHPKYAPSY